MARRVIPDFVLGPRPVRQRMAKDREQRELGIKAARMTRETKAITQEKD